jgi:hypothetical protein
VALIAGVSGLLMLIDKSLHFHQRWQLNTGAFFDLKIFKSRLDAGEDPHKIEREYYKYRATLEKIFPAFGANESLDKSNPLSGENGDYQNPCK